MIDVVLVWHAILRDDQNVVIWECIHNHTNIGVALECAAEEDARRAQSEDV